ncbi:hypothetical protein ACFL6U_20560 [Planctomycetota bacterium]
MMKQRTFHRVVRYSALILVAISAVQVSAQGQGQRGGRRGGGLGDWLVTSESNGRTRESILSFSRDQEENVTGVSISSRGLTELKDVSFAEGKLSFVQTRRGRGGAESTAKFTGTIAEDALTGTMSSDQGDSPLKGKRLPRVPRAVGTWEMKYKRGERDITAKLIIKADAEGNLSGEWPSERGASTISDLTLERRDLTFKRTMKREDQEYVSTFTGTLEREGGITGTFKSEQGETPVTGTQMGAALIGTWNLDVTSDRGEGKQRLVVYPDMSGWYGSVALKGISLEGDKVSFKMTMQMRDQQAELAFTGKLAESGLTGELTSERGSQKITGTKAVNPRGGRGQRGGGAN